MNYYEVLVASPSMRSNDMLTYASEEEWQKGQLVIVPLRAKQAQGIVMKKVGKPAFATKPIVRATAPLCLPETSLRLLEWMTAYYPAPMGVHVSQFIPAGLKQVPRPKRAAVTEGILQLPALATLTDDQQTAVETVAALKKGSTCLLHGDTGTGKTRVYIECARQSLGAQKSVLILTPEIGLTPQLVRDCEYALGAAVITLHSGLTTAEKRQAWLKVLTTIEPVVVIGPRSALFAPFRSLGLVVVDEAHESAYKQEQAPYYDARRVASRLGQIHDAPVILGSATPSVSDYYLAVSKHAPVIRMTTLASSDTVIPPQITVVDAREKSQFSQPGGLSDPMIEGVRAALARGEQSLLFLNRRGTARVVLCQSCGWQAVCPRCDIPLTFHGDLHRLRCHTCGHTEGVPTGCPECHDVDILYKSQGTKSLTETVQRLFPEARVQRFDNDNSKEERFDRHYEAVSRGEVDILVGTQTLTKGLDLPRLSFVGVVAADSALSFPDFTAHERTFQMLLQVLGRIGRGHRAGSAIVQTYQPESPVVQAALTKNYARFYTAEIAERQLFGYPPFRHILKLTCARRTENGAASAAEELARKLPSLAPDAEVIGPAPSFYGKRAGEYRWQIIIKSTRRSVLTMLIPTLPAHWQYDIDPSDLL